MVFTQTFYENPVLSPRAQGFTTSAQKLYFVHFTRSGYCVRVCVIGHHVIWGAICSCRQTQLTVCMRLCVCVCVCVCVKHPRNGLLLTMLLNVYRNLRYYITLLREPSSFTGATSNQIRKNQFVWSCQQQVTIQSSWRGTEVLQWNSFVLVTVVGVEQDIALVPFTVVHGKLEQVG